MLSCDTDSCGWGGACHHGSKVDVYPDGTILCFVTGIELGQGLYTKCAQIAALTLGLEDTSLIEIMRTDTAMTPEGGGTYGSMGSGSNAYGMELACKALKAKLETVDRTVSLATGASEVMTGTMTNAQWVALVNKALQAGVDLSVKSWGEPANARCPTSFLCLHAHLSAPRVNREVCTREHEPDVIVQMTPARPLQITTSRCLEMGMARASLRSNWMS